VSSELANRLKTLRKNKGWSQRELAKRSRVPQSAIHYIEGGNRNPRSDTLQKLAKTLGVTATELLGDSSHEAIGTEKEFLHS